MHFDSKVYSIEPNIIFLIYLPSLDPSNDAFRHTKFGGAEAQNCGSGPIRIEPEPARKYGRMTKTVFPLNWG